MKKNVKRGIIISSSVLVGLLLICLILPFGIMFFAAGGLTVITEKIGYTTPFIFQIESKVPKGKSVSNDVLFDEIKRILKNYDCKATEVEIYDNEPAKFYTIVNEDANVEAGKVLWVYSSGNIGINLNKYNDVRAIMDIWIFVVDHNMHEELEGFCYWFLKTGKMARATEINISIHQFKEFYKNSNVDGLSHKEKVDILTKLWVEKVKYTRPHGEVDVKPMTE